LVSYVGASCQTTSSHIRAQAPNTDALDRLLVVLSQFKNAGHKSGRGIREVEKLGLFLLHLILDCLMPFN
jgi:hypothetical protein